MPGLGLKGGGEVLASPLKKYKGIKLVKTPSVRDTKLKATNK